MEGVVEIEYSTYELPCGQGYMTEAVGGLIQWTGMQRAIHVIIAYTKKSNAASSTVLIKNRFLQCGETEDLYKWEVELRT